MGRAVTMKKLILIALFLSACASPAFAQSILEGVVRDSSGAVVPSSAVIVRQDGRAFERIVESGRDGRFSLSPIGDGDYSLEVVAPGFGVSTMTAHVPASKPIEVTLTPAAVIEAVRVVS